MKVAEKPAGSYPALLLDRDGVINVDKAYVHRIEDMDFIDGIFPLARAAVGAGMCLVVVTNQAGIGRGYYTEAQFQTLTEWMKKQFSEQGAPIAAVYHCPYHPEQGLGEYKLDSFDRKPNPGMILRARRDLDLDLAASVLIGDKRSDIEAARRAEVGLTILLKDREGAVEESEAHLVVNTLHQARVALFGEPTELPKR